MEDFFYRELLKYLYLAEQKRRWNQFTDIPWRDANPESSETLAQCVETFASVEMYLPDFTSKLLVLIRRNRGRAWFHINWGYEESKHSMTLEGWLLASGHRTEEQREEVEKALLGQEWELPFDHPRQMLCYTMVQELATFWNYRNLEKMAAQQHDKCLVTALRVISVDERVHYNFFRNAVKEWMKWDERGTIEDLKYVFDNFTMPGRAQIPGYEEAARILAKNGIYGPREYVRLVKNPILEDLRLDKDFNRMEAEEERYEEEKSAKAALENSVERIEVGEGAKAKNGTGKGPMNSHALNEMLANNKPRKRSSAQRDGLMDWDSRDPIPTYASGHKRSPFLDMVGVVPKERENTSQSVVLSMEALERLPGSRGMPQLDNDLDQKLLAYGDELSNNADELRAERAQIEREKQAKDESRRRTRGKNSRLMDKYQEDEG